MCGIASVSLETVDIRGDAYTLLQGLKPKIELGSKTEVSASTTAETWKIDLAGGEDDDYIDDDALLTEEDRKPVAPKAGVVPVPLYRKWLAAVLRLIC
jgi:hypothetical protein